MTHNTKTCISHIDENENYEIHQGNVKAWRCDFLHPLMRREKSIKLAKNSEIYK